MQIDMKRVGEIVREARNNRKWTQEKLAEEIDINPRMLISIEKGERKPSFETIARIIQTLSIPADLVFRPNILEHTAEEEQFIREFLDAGKQGQQLSVAAARAIWLELRDENQ